MRWILVFLLLYIIPVGLLFKNNDSLKRSSMYASMYTVAITLIVICNIYGSTVNKLESIINNNNYISSKKDKKEDIKLLSDVLRLADLVKFAKYQPLPDECSRSFSQVETFIDNTKEVEIAPKAEETENK